MSHYQKLPKGWSECKIEDVAKTLTDFVASGSFASLRENVQYYDSPNYAILVRTKDLGNNFKGGLVYTDKHGYDFLRNSNLYGGELILPNIGASIGKVFIMPKMDEPTTLAPNSIMVRCWNEPTLKWLYLLFQSTFGQNILASISASTAQGKFNKTDLRDVIIPLPPIHEQERILTQANRLLEYVEKINTDKTDLLDYLKSTKSKILELAMQGKLVPQDPADEPAAGMLRRVNPKARIITDNPHYPQLPDNWVWISIDDLNQYKSKSINPSDSPTDIFDLYSVPIYPKGQPETVMGKEIGSTKQSVRKGDVLLCKINPHLNRVWTIDESSPNIQIASSEWIIIRSNMYSPYLKWMFSAPFFRKMLCSQVSGVGGSLTRAQPAVVKKYLIPIPPYNEQVRIAKRITELGYTLNEINSNLDG